MPVPNRLEQGRPRRLGGIGNVAEPAKVAFWSYPVKDRIPAAVTDAVLASWKEMPQLRVFRVANWQITDRGMQVISGWKNLRALQLRGDVQITDAATAGLSAEMVGELDMQIPRLTNRSFESFSKLARLQTLKLADAANVDDRALRDLSGLAQFHRMLVLDGVRLNGNGVSRARQLWGTFANCSSARQPSAIRGGNSRCKP